MLASITVEAPADEVFALIADQTRRAAFLPDGWRVRRLLGDTHEGVGATMELDIRVGPGVSPVLMQSQEIRRRPARATDQSQLIESPPAADNYLMTWTVVDRDAGCTVYLHVDFTYGGFIGELFARRSLRRSCVQMLQRLKVLAEGGVSP